MTMKQYLLTQSRVRRAAVSLINGEVCPTPTPAQDKTVASNVVGSTQANKCIFRVRARLNGVD